MSSPSKVYFIPEFFEQMKKMFYVGNDTARTNDFNLMRVLLKDSTGGILANLHLDVRITSSQIHVEVFYWSDGLAPQIFDFRADPVRPGSSLYDPTVVQFIADRVFTVISEKEPRVVRNALSVFLENVDV